MDNSDQVEGRMRQQLGRDLRAAREPGTRRILEQLLEADSVLELDARRQPVSSGRAASEDARAFLGELGREPREYLVQLKMEEARELLRHRHLKVWRIAETVGYTSLSSFSRAFKKAHGVCASVMAKQLEPAPESVPTPSAEPSPALALADDHFWYAATSGSLAPEDLGPLTARLRELSDIGASEGEIVCFQSHGTEAEVDVAREIWRGLEPLTWEQRRARLRRTYRTNSPAFFHLLGRHYQNAIVRDPRAAQWLADLALTHVEVNAERIGGVAPSLEALAWAWRGYALYRRAVPSPRRSGGTPQLDWSEVAPGEVRQAFEQAWTRWRSVETLVEAHAEAHVETHAEAHLCLFEGEFLQSIAETDEALTRINRAIVLTRIQGPAEVLVRALVRRLTLLSGTVPLTQLVDEANLVLTELRGLKQGVQAILVYALLAQACEVAGHTDRARRYADLVEQSFERLKRSVARHQRQLQQQRDRESPS